jgi:hypothetical protein
MKTADQLATTWLDGWSYGDDTVLARVVELVNATIEECAKEADHWQDICDRTESKSKAGAYIAGAIRGMKS